MSGFPSLCGYNSTRNTFLALKYKIVNIHKVWIIHRTIRCLLKYAKYLSVGDN